MARVRRLLRILLILAGAVAALVLVVLAVVILRLGAIVKAGVEIRGTQALGVETRLHKASVSLTKGTVTLSDLRVANPEGFSGHTFLTADRIHVAVDLRSFMGEEIHIREVAVNKPHLLWETAGLKTNIGTLMNHPAARQEKPRESGPSPKTAGHKPKPTRLRIDLIRLTDIQVKILAPSSNFKTTISEVEIRNLNGSVQTVVANVLRNLVSPIEKALPVGTAVGKIGRLRNDTPEEPSAPQ